MSRRYIIFGLSAVALFFIFKRFTQSEGRENKTVTSVEKSKQSLPKSADISVSPPATNISTNSQTAIWSLLKQGKGYVVIMRHALAPGIGDPVDFQLNNCATQRNLSNEGRKQAVRTGQAFKTRNIPVSRVLSSQWCRCLETAKLLNLGAVEPFPPLNSFFNDYTTASQQTAKLRQFILNNRNTPGVIIMVTHEVNVTSLVGDIYPKSGESVVLRANEKNKIEVVGQIKPI